ncbi:MAG: efflux RND transporter permease subunit [Luteolibacter sp.]
MARFFIERPIFAWVIAILVMIAGVISIQSLPVGQFPVISPPSVSITASYPGADAETLAKTTTQVIEQRLTGIDHLRYFSSQSTSAGTATITLTFEQGSDPDTAQVQVQNKVQSAMPLLPQEVQQQGVQVAKVSANVLINVALYSKTGEYSGNDLSDMMVSRMRDPLSRVKGVGDTILYGSPYAMRIWIDPLKLNSYQLTFADVIAAIRSENVQVSAGQLGAQPSRPEQMLNAAVAVHSRYQTPEQFATIVLKSAPNGATVTVADVGRVEMGAESYGYDLTYNKMPATSLGIKLAQGANALETIRGIKDRVDELMKEMPSGIGVTYPQDTTLYIEKSVSQVVHTLVEAVVLVFIVMFLFLQNIRATLIPTIAVPVVLLGTFVVMAVAGFSINTLTLFGMVLAIGLLVDDAIVVVENVERLIHDDGLSPKEAAKESMREITGALMGVAVVLSAVFLPMAFFGGSTGIIYRQFSLTIVSAMILSVLVAVILTPALCATILKPRSHKEVESTGLLARFFRGFNVMFERSQIRYTEGVRRVARNWKRSMLVYGLLGVGIFFIFGKLPTGFLPDEDQGMAVALVQGPAGSTSARTQVGINRVRDYLLAEEKNNIDGVFTINGSGFAGDGQNSGIAFAMLKSPEERKGEENNAMNIAGRTMKAMSGYSDGQIFAVVPPPVSELGNATGFDLQLVDTGGLGHERFIQIRDQFVAMAAKDPRLAGVRPNSLEDAPQLKINVDNAKARSLGLDLQSINNTISAAWGASYVNDFIDRGRVKRVYIQADEPFRRAPENIEDFFVRGGNGQMTPFSAFSNLKWQKAPVSLTRYNGESSLQILGQAAAGHSSGDAMRAMEEIHGKLPPGTALEWTGMSYEEKLSSGKAPMLYGLSLLIVFLCLAALYESWSVPISVMLVVPLGVLGALIAAALSNLDNDIYLQVGLITTIGLSAKNAILIIEFAEERMAAGLSPFEAAVAAAKLRLRPILMTSLAFIFGVLPLALATGAGSGGQKAIGRAVVGGMLSATILAIFFVPMFFIIVSKLLGHKNSRREATEVVMRETDQAHSAEAPR